MRSFITLPAALCAIALGATAALAASVTPQTMTERHEEGATRTQSLSARGAARAIQFDVGWAMSADEAKKLGHQAVILLSAMAQDCSELPLRRVVVQVGKKEIPLKRIATEIVTVNEDSLAFRMHGKCREDSFYLAPAGALLGDGEIFADFAVNRRGFRVTALPLSPPDFVRKTPAKARVATPNSTALSAFLTREYPGFAAGEPAP